MKFIDGLSSNNITEISIDNNATYEFLDDNIVITPNLNFNGDISIFISVTDGISSISDSFILTVAPVNDPPEILSNPIPNIFVNDLYQYNIVVNDPDDDIFQFSLTNAPIGMEIDNNGLLLWTPEYTGLFDAIIITVTDSNPDNPQSVVQEFYLDVKLNQVFNLHFGNNLISYLVKVVKK